MSEKRWLKKYPASVPQTINLNQYQNISEVAEEAFKKYHDRVAFSNLGQNLTYQELDEKSAQFAAFLQNTLKLNKGDKIALQMPNLIQNPIALFGAFRAGLIVVNTNPLYTANEMEHQFKDSGVKAIVILAQFAHLLEKILPETAIEHIVVTEVGDELSFVKKHLINFVLRKIKKMVPNYNLKHYSWSECLTLGSGKNYVQPKINHEDTAFLQYTGGTTGIAKGAILTHKNIIANMLQINAWMNPKLRDGQEIAITPLPLYHIFSLTVCSLALMRYGTQNVLITNPRDLTSFIKDMQKYPFTILTGVNTLFNALINHPDIKKVDFSHVKVCVAGAMALQKAVKDKWTEVTGTYLVEGYGLTETSPVACCNPIDGTDKVGTIGLPLPETEIKLIDDSNNDVTWLGQPGEIWIKGPQVMKGYYNRPDETEKVLKDGWVATGDIGLMDSDGFAKIVDRKKDMILVSGFNVYPNEIEDVLAKHPKILEVAAIGYPDEHSGEVVKVVIVKKDPSLTEKEVTDFCKKYLTNYKIPKHVEFRTELPKTNVGKVLRRALRES